MSYFNPTKWFRSSTYPKDQQKGFVDPIDVNTVVESGELGELDFTAVNVRPLTYAEASVQILPAANSRTVNAEPYSNIDESKLAVQQVDEFEKQQRSSRPHASVHVQANIEYGPDGIYDFSRRRKRSRKHRRERRQSKGEGKMEDRRISVVS